jgi:diguanylate cyclase (GGDEF)-like protein/PAS domain S-box-containing protein
MVENLEELLFLVAVTPDGFRYQIGSRTLHALLRLAPEDFAGKRPEDIFPAEQAARFAARYREAIARRASLRYEESFPTPAGRRDFQTTLTPIVGTDGQVELLVGIAVDVTERNRLLREVETQWQLADQRARTIEVLLESAGEGVFSVDTEERVVLWNPAATRILGYTADEMRGRCAFEVLHSRYPDGSLMPREACLIHRAVCERRNFPPDEDYFSHKDGRAVPVRLSVAPLPDGGAVVVFADITHLKRMQDELRRQAETDPLTGLANRRAFFVAFALGRAAAERNGTPSALLMLDIDHFKLVNDRHGHAAGDAVLRALAGQIRASMRSGDLAARLGGEEFAILLCDSSPEGAARFAERLRTRVAQNLRIPGKPEEAVTISIGLAQIRPDEDADAALARADQALYEAKRQGRNRVVRAPEPA